MKLLFLFAMLSIAHAQSHEQKRSGINISSDSRKSHRLIPVPDKKPLNGQQKKLLIEKFESATQNNMAHESLMMLMHPGGEEHIQFQRNLHQLIKLWKKDKGTKLAKLSPNQIDEALHMLTEKKLTADPGFIQHARKMMKVWTQDETSNIAKLDKVQKKSVTNLAGLLHQNLSDVINSPSNLTDEIRAKLGSDFMESVSESRVLYTLTEDTKNTLRDKFVTTMNDIAQKPLSRIGVLSMLVNPTRQEQNEFQEHLREMIAGWTSISKLDDLQYLQLNEVVRVISGLSSRYAKERKEEIVKLGKAQKLSRKQMMELPEKLVNYADELRRSAAGW